MLYTAHSAHGLYTVLYFDPARTALKLTQHNCINPAHGLNTATQPALPLTQLNCINPAHGLNNLERTALNPAQC